MPAGNRNFAPSMDSIQAFYPLLHQPARVVITTHQKPDGDALGSSLGLYHFLVQLGHTVTVISPTNWPDFLNWLPGIETVINFESQREKSRQLIADAQYIFCLDFNILHRTKHLEPLLEAASAKKILIDHHQEPQVAASIGVSAIRARVLLAKWSTTLSLTPVMMDFCILIWPLVCTPA